MLADDCVDVLLSRSQIVADGERGKKITCDAYSRHIHTGCIDKSVPD